MAHNALGSDDRHVLVGLMVHPAGVAVLVRATRFSMLMALFLRPSLSIHFHGLLTAAAA